MIKINPKRSLDDKKRIIASCFCISVEGVSRIVKKNKQDSLNILASELSVRGFSKFLLQLNKKNRLRALVNLHTPYLKKIIFEIPSKIRSDFLKDAPVERIRKLIEGLVDDKAISLLRETPPKKVIKIIENLPKKQHKTLSFLLEFPPDTAGGMMTQNIIILKRGMKVRDAIDKLKKQKNLSQDIAYVVSHKNRLFGEIKIKNLIFARPNQTLERIAKRNVARVNLNMDREAVIKITSEKDVIALPVVNDYGIILGEITIDDIIDAIEKEVNEDFTLSSGNTESIEKMMYSSTFESIKARLPWLLFTVVGETLFTGHIIATFDGLLSKYLSLSFFLPVLMCLTGDASIQSSTVIVRSLIMNKIFNLKQFILNDIKVGAFMGFILGGISAALSFFWLNSPKIGLIVWIAITTSMLASNLIGGLLPLLFNKFNIDPAIASGPILTTTMDIISVSVYFLVATLFLETFLVGI